MNRWHRVGICTTVGALAALLLVRPSPGQASMRTAGVAHAASEQSTTTTTAPAPSSPSTTTPPLPPGVSVNPPEPGTVFVPVVGSVPLTPPPPPVHGTVHPLLTDPAGDASMATGPGQSQSDPTLDLTQLDVTADATSVTMTLHVVDAAGQPLAAWPAGQPHMLDYGAVLFLDHGYFSFNLSHDLDTGAVTTGGTFWYPDASSGSGGAYSGGYVAGVRGSLDLTTGVATITADFASMNEALTADQWQSHPPVGPGTDVGLLGRSETGNATVPGYGYEADDVRSDDPGYVYRLGD